MCLVRASIFVHMLCFIRRSTSKQKSSPILQCRTFANMSFLNILKKPTETIKHYEKKTVPFSAEDYYSVVEDVNQYSSFLPWTLKSKVTTQPSSLPNGKTQFKGDLEIGFQVFKERYTSIVECKRPESIIVRAADSSMFDILTNEWRFKQGLKPNVCEIEFLLEFRFASQLHQNVASLFISEVAQTTVSSFDKRVSSLHKQMKLVSQKSQTSQTSDSQNQQIIPRMFAQNHNHHQMGFKEGFLNIPKQIHQALQQDDGWLNKSVSEMGFLKKNSQTPQPKTLYMLIDVETMGQILAAIHRLEDTGVLTSVESSLLRKQVREGFTPLIGVWKGYLELSKSRHHSAESFLATNFKECAADTRFHISKVSH